MPRPLVGIATNAVMDETRDTADDQGDQINSTQQTFAPDGRALLTIWELSQEALKRTLKAVPCNPACASPAAQPRRRGVGCKVLGVIGADAPQRILHAVGIFTRDDASLPFRRRGRIGILDAVPLVG